MKQTVAFLPQATMSLLEQPDLVSSTDEYARRFSGSVGEYFLQVQWQTVEAMLPAAEQCRVLDVGGGHAQLARPLTQAGYDVTVLGSDRSCLPRLDREVGRGNYQFLTGNLLEIPLDNASYDVVLAFRLLPHLNQWQRFVSEICRVAKQTVIVDYPDVQSFNWFSNQAFAAKKVIEQNTRRYRCFRRREITTAFEANDFCRFESRGQFFLPMAVHRLCRSANLSRTVESLSRTLGLNHFFGSPVIIRAECGEAVRRSH